MTPYYHGRPHVRDIVSQHIFSRVPFFILPLQPTAILYVLRHLRFTDTYTFIRN